MYLNIIYVVYNKDHTPSVPNYKEKKSHLLRKLKHKNLEYSNILCYLWNEFYRKM